MHWNRLARSTGVVAALAFLASAFTPIWNTIGHALAIPTALEPSGAIVVLAEGQMPDGSLRDESMRRTIHGVKLHRVGLAPLLILSGPKAFRLSPAEAEVRAQLAQTMGIPADSILKVTDVRTTHDEASQVVLLLRPRQITRIILVTESFHMRRAKMVFERTGLQVLAAPSDDYSRSSGNVQGRLKLVRRILEESAALVYYRIFGYI